VADLFPPAPDAAAYDALHRDDALLARGVQEIARRHGLAPDGAARFPDGSLPVYAVGPAHVLKLYPPCYAHERAIERAGLEAVDGRLGIPTPRVEATGAVDGWRYVLMSRLHGENLAQAWPRIATADRERLMEALGRALAALHAVDASGHDVPRPSWPAFVAEQTETATARQRARGLDDRWVDQIPEFLASVALPSDSPSELLHTEIMREHLLVRETGEGWALSGLFDFEPSMQGAADYEFASVGIFTTCGEPSLLRRLLLAYGKPADELGDDLSRRFLAYALLHRYSNLPWYLRRLPPPPSARSLSDLATAWWPLSSR
jgi:hygromycin-B 7''-O-kinase